MAYIDFIQQVHTSTKRNYLERVVEHDKAECASISKQFGEDYFDGDRRYGYGGYRYDGRWRKLAEDLARHYDLKPGQSILDIGCGKGFLLYEFTQVIPGIKVSGVDIAEYAIQNAKEEIKTCVRQASAVSLPYPDKSFDFIISINTLHNLYIYDLKTAVQEIERVGKNDKKYIVMDSYRSEQEKVNLMYWQLTCECFYTPKEWEWLLKSFGYRGDFGCIYYE